MCSSRKYPFLYHGRDFFKNPIPLEIAISFIHFFESFGLLEPKPHPHPLEIPIPSVVGV